jgi:hypothetical protein
MRILTLLLVTLFFSDPALADQKAPPDPLNKFFDEIAPLSTKIAGGCDDSCPTEGYPRCAPLVCIGNSMTAAATVECIPAKCMACCGDGHSKPPTIQELVEYRRQIRAELADKLNGPNRLRAILRMQVDHDMSALLPATPLQSPALLSP